jgi:hypothetical protein
MGTRLVRIVAKTYISKRASRRVISPPLVCDKCEMPHCCACMDDCSACGENIYCKTCDVCDLCEMPHCDACADIEHGSFMLSCDECYRRICSNCAAFHPHCAICSNVRNKHNKISPFFNVALTWTAVHVFVETAIGFLVIRDTICRLMHQIKAKIYLL